MKITQSQKEFKKGERGIAKVSMIAGGNVKVTMQESGNSYNITKDDLPKYFPFREGKEIKCTVTLDGETNAVMYANPVSGDYKVKFAHIGKEDEVPAPVTRQGAKGAFTAFDVFVVITEGAWRGASGVRFLNPSLFKKDEDGNLWVDGYGKALTDLTEFLDVTGLSALDIKYSENPLPEIQRLALELGKEFMASFLDGKVQSLSEYFSLDDGFEPQPTPEDRLQCVVNGEGKKDSVEFLTEEEIATYRKNGFTVK